MVKKSAFIAIIGRPNVGKSTLLNFILGEKVAIVSPKPQTTRNRIMGVLTENEEQMIFIDTPGMHKPRTKLGDFMINSVNKTVDDVDIALMVVDATFDKSAIEAELIEKIKRDKIPSILAVNKTDLVEKKELLIKRIAELSELHEFDAVVPISAVTGDGVDILKDELSRLLPEGPAFFPEDTLTDQPERTLASEMIREKLLYVLSDELPHGIGVVIERMKERANGDIVDIDATIYCEKESHKGMVIGKKGAVLKKIGSEARQDIEHFLDLKVNLKLWVKVKEDWRNREGMLREMGYTERK